MEWIELIIDGKYQSQNDPKDDKPVLAQLQHWYTKGIREAILIRVHEDDVAWRTADDNSEISYDWNVVRWKRIE
jgi:hypothetical protein